MDPEQGKRLNLLQVPELERNFLLSPPGSPPIGWVQQPEAGPVPGGFSEDIMEHAFSFVSLVDFELDGGKLVEYESDSNSQDLSQSRDSNRVCVTFDASLPSIQIDLCQDDDSPSPRLPLPKTSIPPVYI